MDERFMALALAEAQRAFEHNEVPVGAVIVQNERVIAAACNRRESAADPLGHAELLALSAASRALSTWRMNGCCIYVTLEPCVMCAAALQQAGIARIVFGAFDPKMGGCGGAYMIPGDERLGRVVPVVGGVLEPQCAALMQRFFAARR